MALGGLTIARNAEQCDPVVLWPCWKTRDPGAIGRRAVVFSGATAEKRIVGGGGRPCQSAAELIPGDAVLYNSLWTAVGA